MAYGIDLNRHKISTRIVRAEEKVVTMYVTAATAHFTQLTVDDDLVLTDTVKARSLTGVTVSATNLVAERKLIVPTCITGAWNGPFTDGMMWVDEEANHLVVVWGATVHFLKFSVS